MNSRISCNAPQRKQRAARGWRPVLAMISVLILSCTCSDWLPQMPTQQSPSATHPPEGPPVTQPPEVVPDAPTTEPLLPPTPAVWEQISGMWSGCPQTAGADVFAEPCALQPGGYPLGNFLTMYLLPTCSVGEMCGSYIKGRFDSEFILYHLTLVEIIGDTVYMFGDPPAGEMFAGMEMDVEISRAGPNLRVADSRGESYIIPSGCDPVIANAFQCWNTVP